MVEESDKPPIADEQRAVLVKAILLALKQTLERERIVREHILQANGTAAMVRR